MSIPRKLHSWFFCENFKRMKNSITTVIYDMYFEQCSVPIPSLWDKHLVSILLINSSDLAFQVLFVSHTAYE